SDDHSQHFDLTRAPLLRFTLVRLGAERYRLLFTFHHILVDGWSMPVLLGELLALYQNRGNSAALSPVTPYRDYLAWIARQDRDAAIAAWQHALSGLEEPTLLAARDAARAPLVPERIAQALSEEQTAALNREARAR